MPRIGAAALPLVAVACASLTAIAGWGFTVDDALISTRVAHHIATGDGYRMNPGGPLTDCVTPLGWAHLLAPVSVDGPWAGLQAARWFGVACHLATAVMLGVSWQKRGARLRSAFLAALPLALCLPWGAWASAGMETPLVTLLVTCTLLAKRWTLSCATLAAGLRPELMPWAFTLAVLSPAAHPGRRVTNLALVLTGPVLVAIIRASVFGSPAPLAVLAKPSDFEHGLDYVLRGTLLCGVPLLLVSVRAYSLVDEHVRRLALGVVAHLGAIVVAGGDWMALFRLFVPLLPTCAFVGTELLMREPRWFAGLKVAVASVACGLLTVNYLESTGGVLAARQALVAQGADVLSGRIVATVDVGWVGANADVFIVDLAGVTDREVALLPGGHTSKKLPRDFLLRRQVDALVLLLAPGVTEDDLERSDWRALPYARVVERRVTQLDGAEAFVPVRLLALAGTNQHYLVLHRLTQRMAVQRLTASETSTAR